MLARARIRLLQMVRFVLQNYTVAIFRRFSHFLERILTEHVDMKNSSESKLQIYSVTFFNSTVVWFRIRWFLFNCRARRGKRRCKINTVCNVQLPIDIRGRHGRCVHVEFENVLDVWYMRDAIASYLSGENCSQTGKIWNIILLSWRSSTLQAIFAISVENLSRR